METCFRNPCCVGAVFCLTAVALILSPAVFGATPWRTRPVVTKSFTRNFAPELVASDALRPMERTFLEKAAEMTRDEIQMAQLAVGQATSSEVRTVAQQIAGDHKQINDAVEALRRRKNAAPPPPPGEAAAEVLRRLAEKVGAEFDREFARVMFEMHDRAVALFDQAAAEVKDPDVRELAGSYIPLLRDHRNKLAELKKALE